MSGGTVQPSWSFGPPPTHLRVRDRAALRFERQGCLCALTKKQKSGDAPVPTPWRMCLALSLKMLRAGLAAMGMGAPSDRWSGSGLDRSLLRQPDLIPRPGSRSPTQSAGGLFVICLQQPALPRAPTLLSHSFSASHRACGKAGDVAGALLSERLRSLAD